jgi:hypothetical protein
MVACCNGGVELWEKGREAATELARLTAQRCAEQKGKKKTEEKEVF